MIINYIYGTIAVLVVSLVSFAGVFFLSLKDNTFKKYISFFISLAVGALLGGAFIHLIPEIVESGIEIESASIFVMFGVLLFFVIEKFIHWHHHGDCEDESHIKPVGRLLLLTDGFHNFIDGIIIGASFLISIPLGIATTLAVILHEIPQEIGDFAVLVHSGFSRKKALFYNFISALASVLGVIFVFLFGSVIENFIVWLLPVAAGGFIYIAIADLIPELHKTKNIKYSITQLFIILIGIFLMFLLTFLE
jgi:zinc and cadmium transporter